MRIGELSRRTGVSPELLRAWEQRYGLLEPARSQGRFRLYSDDDEFRVRRMAALIADGLAAAEAARQAKSAPVTASTAVPAVGEIATELQTALDSFDAGAAHAAIDRLFATVSIDAALSEVLIPYLHRLGERWAAGLATVAQEHFASHLIRGRLLGLARDSGTAAGPAVVLAGLPGEAHDLGLLMFAILVARRGWRATFLGADTPFETLDDTVQRLLPSLVVLATTNADRFHACAGDIARVSARVPVAIAAPVDEPTVKAAGGRLLMPDIAKAARSLHPAGRE